MRNRLIAVEEEIVESLNRQIPIIQQRLIDAIRENYEKNKRRTVKLLTYAGDDVNSLWSHNDRQENPLIAINYEAVIGFSIGAIAVLIVLAALIA